MVEKRIIVTPFGNFDLDNLPPDQSKPIEKPVEHEHRELPPLPDGVIETPFGRLDPHNPPNIIGEKKQ